jgi:hypothetical protein
VKKPTKMAQPLVYHFDKPAKDRIIDAADKVYRIFGIRESARLPTKRIPMSKPSPSILEMAIASFADTSAR